MQVTEPAAKPRNDRASSQESSAELGRTSLVPTAARGPEQVQEQRVEFLLRDAEPTCLS